MPELTVGPLYCPICPGEWDIEDMHPMSYFADGSGECTRCGYKYRPGDKWIFEASDLDIITADIDELLKGPRP